ncbi:MAG TPA: gamma-glutamyltransferase, partial [Steroidobacteraceae bacterium]|nr:gamma-glutamyltransferase [Steroidobacteraceae bacterium]
SGLGGGGFYLLHRASDGKQIFVDAREVAPMAATKDMFLGPDGEAVAGRSTQTALAAAIPGEAAALEHLAETYGRLTLAQNLEPAIRLARDGFPVYARLVSDITSKKKAFERTPDATKIFLLRGAVPPEGHILRQRDLARSFELLAKGGADEFYRGELGRRLVAGVSALGGIWSTQDFANYRLIEREPLVGSYRGTRIVTAPPPSAGGIVLINVLNILDGYDQERLDSASRKHLVIEGLRRAHRDRAEYLGDPAFVKNPVERLVSPEYAAGQRTSIRLDRATPSAALPGYVGDASSGIATTHFSIMDREGNRVAGSITLNAWFGTGLVAPGTGILLNNQMDDFSVKPGTPNMFELVGADANAVAPGKRPLSSMAPTFLESERGVAILGSPGGSYIPTLVLLGTLNRQQGFDAMQIVTARRFHHQYLPDVVTVEEGAFTDEERASLAQRGHTFRAWPATIGNMQVVTWDYSGKVSAGSDPRAAGKGIVR